MLRAQPMRKARICILERDVDRVTRALGRLGVVHLSSCTEESGGQLRAQQGDEDISRCRDLAGRLERLMELTAVSPAEEPPARAAHAASLGALEGLVAALEKGLGPRIAELENLEQALGETQEIVDELAPYKDMRAPISRLAESSLLEIKLGRVPAGELPALRAGLPPGVVALQLGSAEERAVSEQDTAHLLVVASRRRRFAMETVLNAHHFAPGELPAYEEQTPAAVHAEATARHGRLAQRAEALRAELARAGADRREQMQRAAAELEVQRKVLEAEQSFGTTWATAVITGWVPSERSGDLERVVLRAAGGQAVVELSDPDDEDVAGGRVPTAGSVHPLVAPFQRLVGGYGTATYTEIEPTVMFAISFLAMFGLIFGDLGHGLCLLAVGLLIRRRSSAAVLRDAGFIIAACGLASVLSGTFLQGSFFGKSLKELGFPLTLGFEPIRFDGAGAGAKGHVVRYLILALVLGLVLINLGVMLNIVNRLRRKDYAGGLLSRFGVVGIVFYWGALGVALRAIATGGLKNGWAAAGVVGLPLLVLVFHDPLQGLLARRRPLWREGLAMGLFEGLIEALETVMVYLSNTFSFLRVAAFALSHAALCYTVFVLEGLVRDLPAGPAWSATVFVLGTALIIGMEGLIVAIQILRLEYYEFFTKFFEAEGVRYRPFRLR